MIPLNAAKISRKFLRMDQRGGGGGGGGLQQRATPSVGAYVHGMGAFFFRKESAPKGGCRFLISRASFVLSLQVDSNQSLISCPSSTSAYPDPLFRPAIKAPWLIGVILERDQSAASPGAVVGCRSHTINSKLFSKGKQKSFNIIMTIPPTPLSKNKQTRRSKKKTKQS